MTILLSETSNYRLLCDGLELLVEESHSSDCIGQRRWLPAAIPCEVDVMNVLLKKAFWACHVKGKRPGVVFCDEVDKTEMLRIVRQPAELAVIISECIEISTTRDGLGAPIWYCVEDLATQNNLLASALIRLCAGI